MASTDFLENVISSKVDENIVSDLANSLESSISNASGVTQTGKVSPRLVTSLFSLFLKFPPPVKCELTQAQVAPE